MIKIPLTVAVVASLLAATPAVERVDDAFGALAEGKRVLVIMGIGAITCSKFADVDRPAAFGDMAFDWAQGFMTATNIERHHNHQPQKNLNGFPQEEQRGRLEIYCAKHGLLITAIEELYDSMPDVPDVP